MCSLFPVSCFFTFYYFLLCNHFIDNCISCFFRSSLTFISGDIKQKIGEVKRQDVKNSKKQEIGNKEHIVEQTLFSNRTRYLRIFLITILTITGREINHKGCRISSNGEERQKERRRIRINESLNS